MMSENGLSTADAILLSDRNNNGGSGNGMFGQDGWWVIVLFLIWGMWGFGGTGFGNGGGSGLQGTLTRTDLSDQFAFNDLQNGIRNISDSVNLGFSNLNSTICHQQYDTAMQTNAIQAAVNGGFSALNSTICQQQYDLASQINGVNNTIQNGFNSANIVALQGQNAIENAINTCCCNEREAIANLNYNLSTQACDTRNLMQANANATQNLIQSTTRDMIDTNNANTRAILEKLTAQEIAAKDAQIAAQNQKLFAAELAASQSAQNAYLINTLRPTPVPCYPASSPCGYNWNPSVLSGAYGFNNGCGCGCN